ncbi:hypothetical protein DFJ58DRAFT_27193 [Suillus subalutaceus]|uniref:uncharacterized protein n=1 Tax=Suillus subalutaceus TaxID=48586 RepID=UPI001B85C785|nr:uncharacterized protein DFJ58DRAFT_27193 [Suillus subalutaceus]KAG1844516.1 hypothetical protein DFJ58DRAFT_27193 [Suillus subalutaceus]
MRLLLTIFIFLCLVGAIQAQAAPNTTNATSSTPTPHSSELPPSLTSRSLWTIVSSSVLTLFACTYSAIHPNILSPKDSPYGILRRQLGIIIMALIAPELIVTWAMRQWFSARCVTIQFEKSGYPNIRPESEEQYVQGPQLYTLSRTPNTSSRDSPASQDQDTTRVLLAHPEAPTPRYGGTRVLAKPFNKLFKGYLSEQYEDYAWTFTKPLKKMFKTYVSERSEDHTWTQTHSFFVLMGGFMLYVDGEPYLTLRPDDILELTRKECIDVPILTANQIYDRSKGNAISKGLVMLQVAWFVTQLIIRTFHRLEAAQLEVGTLAFAVLNFLTYAVWWDKPLNVQCPHPVYWKSTESRPEDYINLSDRDKPARLGIFSPVLSPIIELIGLFDVPTSIMLRVPTFDGSIKLKRSDMMVIQLAALSMATIFGGIHCTAWFLVFATHQEQLLWRVCALTITGTPWLFYFATSTFDSRGTAVLIFLYFLIGLVSIILYITARAILLILMFTSLRYLPVQAYKTVNWVSLVPHL